MKALRKLLTLLLMTNLSLALGQKVVQRRDTVNELVAALMARRTAHCRRAHGGLERPHLALSVDLANHSLGG